MVGAYVDEDVTRKAQVSAQVEVGSGRVVVDRIQTFDGTNPAREGITLGLGAPVPAEVWVFPAGVLGEGATEQVVVFNPTDEVAEVEVEVRLEDPETNGVPEPFEATVAPHRYSIVDLHEPNLEVTETTPRRIPDDVNHSIIVRSLNGVAVTAEKVLTRSAPQTNVGVGVTLGAPLAAPTWLLAAGGVERGAQRERHRVQREHRTHRPVQHRALDDGGTVEIESLQDLEIAPGGQRLIRMRDHIQLEAPVARHHRRRPRGRRARAVPSRRSRHLPVDGHPRRGGHRRVRPARQADVHVRR